MSYYKKNKEVLLEKAFDKCHNGGKKRGKKEGAKKYYQANKKEIKKREIKILVYA